MKVGSTHFRTIWLKDCEPEVIGIIDQRHLPHRFIVEDLHSVYEMATAISDMHVRGAGLIGAAAAFGMYLAALEADKTDSFDEHLLRAAELLKSTRPTAVNLVWAVNRQLEAISRAKPSAEKISVARKTAIAIADEDAESCRNIGLHGVNLIEGLSREKRGDTVNILTHCNAGWLAFVDFGSALAPIYEAVNRGIKVHVWVDETRPRNQGANLTAWELLNQGVPHTVIADSAGGHLMQSGQVDLIITGADRVTSTGDVANKIGTYLKALAAHDNEIPFYVALPSSTLDWNAAEGETIPIELRSGDEIKYVAGLCEGEIKKVLVTPPQSPALNYAFDITPAKLITGLITERGICQAKKDAILSLFPEKIYE